MDFKLAFRHTLPHAGDPELLSLLPPSGERLAFAQRGGPLCITAVPDGNHRLTVDLEEMPRITCLGWAANSNILVGNEIGGVLQLNVLRNPIICAQSLPALSYISTRSNRPVKAIAFDLRRCLLVIATDGEVQVWGIYIFGQVQYDGVQHEWGAIDVVACEHNGIKLQVSNTEFFGAHHYLLITTERGFIVWKDEDKALLHFEHDPYNAPMIGKSVVSPDSHMLAASGQDGIIRIWPLSDEGPIMSQQQTFVVPAPPNPVITTALAPITFLNKSIVTTDSADKVYVISLDGTLQSTFSIEANYRIHSISANNTTINMIAKGPARSTLLIGYTNDGIKIEATE
ncbi:hypothetical protein FRC08_000881 [Ceratobasidium sp. 394]|nr:hypothetical protein FRC08_000881 [Ceratobasidium sp. 394]